jgi:hypothetical protein
MGTVYATLLSSTPSHGCSFALKVYDFYSSQFLDSWRGPARNSLRMRKSHNFAANTAKEVNQ